MLGAAQQEMLHFPSPLPVSVDWFYCMWASRPKLAWASQVVLEVKNPLANAGDLRGAGLILGLGRSFGEGHGNPLQSSCLENPMDRGAWRATVHRVTKSWTRLKRLSTHKCEQTQTCSGNSKRYSNYPQREKTFLEWGFQIGKL